MKFAINQKWTEARMWLSERIKPRDNVSAQQVLSNALIGTPPANLNQVKPQVTANSPLLGSSASKEEQLQHLLLTMMGNKLSGRVRSNTRDRYNNWSTLSFNNDVAKLREAFSVVEQLHNEPTLRAINESMTRHGIKNGFKFQFSATSNNEDQKLRAKILNEICAPVAAMINGDRWMHSDSFIYGQDCPVTLGDISYNLGVFCNLPIHLAYDINKNTVKQITPLTPYMWQINSDESFKFADITKAYGKFDSATGKLDKYYPATNIAFGLANRPLDFRYGIPFAYNLGTEIETLRSIVDGLDESRKAGAPKNVIFAEGQQGQGITQKEFQRLLDSRPGEALQRGDYLGALANIFHQVIPGKGSAQTINAGTGYFTEFGDANLIREIVGLAYGSQFGLLFDTHKSNRATLDLLIKLRAEVRRVWRMNLTLSIIFPIFCRVIVAAMINSEGLTCEVTYDEENTPEELAAEVDLMLKLKDENLVSQKNAHDISCKALGLDAKTDQEQLDAQKQTSPIPDSAFISSAPKSNKNYLLSTKQDIEKLQTALLKAVEQINTPITDSERIN